jgi:hypothetical protein
LEDATEKPGVLKLLTSRGDHEGAINIGDELLRVTLHAEHPNMTLVRQQRVAVVSDGDDKPAPEHQPDSYKIPINTIAKDADAHLEAVRSS